MKHDVIEINIPYEKYGVTHTDSKATLTTYIKEMYPDYQDTFERPVILICPGGGYEHLSPREGEAIALKMLDLGYNAVILRYSLLPNHYPSQIMEAAYSVHYIRQHAKEWDINPNKLIVAGFSAGGHVAASIGTMYKDPILSDFLKEELHCEPEDVKPDGLLLGYPVISSGEAAHRGSFERLLGEEQYDRLLEAVSLEKRVDADTPKTFIWHTFEDGSVPLENTLLYVSAMRKAGVPVECHIFPKGGHGLGLGTKETSTKNGNHMQLEVSVWPELFATWLENTI